MVTRLDALSPFGIKHLDMPMTPPRVWSAIRTARRSKLMIQHHSITFVQPLHPGHWPCRRDPDGNSGLCRVAIR
jgi:hypothetical protein